MPESSQRTPRSAAGATILIVDDEPDLAETLSRFLERAGFRVDVAPDLRSALATIATTEPDVILSDFNLRGLNGAELYAELERHHPHLCRRFVLMAGDSASGPVQAFVDRAGVPHLAKPFKLAAMLQAIKAAASAGAAG